MLCDVHVCTCRYAFPTATHLLCLRHIMGNVKDYLTKKVALTKKSRKEVLNKLFGQDGVVSADDSFVFEERTKELKNSCSAEFLPYLEKRLIPALKDNVLLPRLERGKITLIHWLFNLLELIHCLVYFDIICLCTVMKIENNVLLMYM